MKVREVLEERQSLKTVAVNLMKVMKKKWKIHITYHHQRWN